MKRLLFILFLFIASALSAHAQQFANSWIHYDQQYFKFSVYSDGLYRIDYATLQNAGVPVSTVTGAQFQIFGRGEEVPIYVSTDNLFSSTDFIEFYALKNDGWLDSTLYDTTAWQGNDKVSLFTDTISYFLTWNNQSNHLRLKDFSNSLANRPPKESWCWVTSTVVYGGTRNSYFQGKPAMQGEPVFDSDFSKGEGYSGTVVTRKADTKTVPTPYPNLSGPPALLKAQWMSRLPVPHNMEVSMKGQLIRKYKYPQFNTMQMDTVLSSNSLLTAGNSTVVFSTANSPAVNDANAVSYVEIRYPSYFNADNKTSFSFSLDASGGNKYLEIYNFNESSTVPVLYDFTNGLRLTAIISNDTLKFQLPPSATERNLLLFANTTSGVVSPASSLKPVHFTDFSQSVNQGDFIIVSHSYFIDDSNGYVQQYAQFKNSTGQSAVIVNVEELYDQFSYGINLHPASFRNFTTFVLDNWSNPEKKHIFLIGKGIEFTTYNATPSTRKHCYVPTFGVPGSDVLLTAERYSPVPRIPIGRIPVMSSEDIRIYLNKAKDYVAAQNAPQVIADKFWMKRVLHLGGGSNAQDQAIFQYYLNSYKPFIEDSVYFGGKVYSFFKTSSDPIQQATSSQLRELIDNGISLITFFGHSSNNAFDFNLDHPQNYNNIGKYPVILSNGCLLGNMFQDGTDLGDEFVFAENKGAIAFIAAATFSVSNSLDAYTRNFYSNLGRRSYNKSLGNIIKGGIADMTAFGLAPTDRLVVEQMGLNGDPSLVVNTTPKPDYAIEPGSVSFNPTVVTAGLDSFKLQLVVTNLGKATDDSIYVDITRYYPDGHSYPTHHRKIKAPYFVDTLVFDIKTESFTSLGLNQFRIKVDADNQVDEISEMNNEIRTDLLILSDDIIPVYPYDFSIVGKQGVELKASTVNAFSPAREYIFEIDTTELFNSPFKKSTKILQSGGVVRWKPPVTLSDSTVYYWRASVDSSYHHSFSWHTSSFIFLNGSSPGWNQSHYYQFLKDKYGNILLPPNRRFKYTDDLTTVGVFNGLTTYYWNDAPLTWDQPAFYINNVLMANWTCGGGANLMFAVIDSATGIHWESVNQNNSGYGQYHNIHCWPQNLNAFYFDGGSQYTDIINFINTIPKGFYVLVMSLNDAKLRTLPQNVKDAFHTLGAQKIDTISVLRPYVFFGKKGSTDYPVTEIVGNAFNAVIDTNFVIPGSWNNGYQESTIVGPSVKWTSLHWKTHEIEPGNDNYKLEVFGLNNNNTETLLFPNVVARDTLINGISSSQYPFLKLRLTSQDTVHRTPVQLDFWRINFDGVPEAALNPVAYNEFTDTVPLQQNMKLNVAVENVSEFDMDSLTIKYVITDAKNTQHIVYNKLDSLRAGDTLHTNFLFPVSGSAFSGINNIFIEVNPYDKEHQQEQYHFNNLGQLSFTTSRDMINPLLDVTFDGIHILDKDIVSPKPAILIRLKDDSKNLPLNDTSLLNIRFLYPDGSMHKVYFDGIKNIFTPASEKTLAKSNTAQAEINPDFSVDGIYTLLVQGYDRSGNVSGDYDYQVSFEVINKSMISNVLNYPNPFTTKTQFVFVLTGSEIPSFMKIQIMTVTGKVVREIFKNELGPIRIGKNITEFAWDGTDQYGDALANGLYLYRVVTNIDNKQIDKYETGTDKYFKHNFGKMYLMR